MSMHQRSGDIVFLGCRLFLFLRFDVWRGSGGCHIVTDVFDWAGCRFLLGWRGDMRRGLSATSRFSTVRVLYRVRLPYPLRYPEPALLVEQLVLDFQFVPGFSVHLLLFLESGFRFFPRPLIGRVLFPFLLYFFHEFRIPFPSQD